MADETYIGVSGGFDPLHGGHLDYLKHAAEYGSVVVFLNTDEWLKRKKGYVFMTWKERAAILRELKCVYDVKEAVDDDDTVSESIKQNRGWIKKFGKGGDRNRSNTPEEGICRQWGIEIIYNLGGSKTQSSSDLVKNVQNR